MALSSTSSVPASQLDRTFGCWFIAIIFSSAFWGIGCLQLYLYYEKYWRSDRTWLKVYLFLIWVLDTVQQVLLSHSTYVYFVRGIGDHTLLALISKTTSWNTILIPIINTMVQIIFVRRTWYISSKNTILTGLLLLPVLGQFAIGLAYSIEVSGLHELAQLSGIVHLELAANCMVAFTDTVLAFTIMFLLWKSRSGVKRTDSVIHRLIMYTVGSGLVTTLWALVALIGAITASGSFVYVLAGFTVAKVYFNCVLASLNVRSSLRGALDKESGRSSIRLETLHFASDAANEAPIHKRFECRSSVDFEGGSDERQIWGDSSTAV